MRRLVVAVVTAVVIAAAAAVAVAQPAEPPAAGAVAGTVYLLGDRTAPAPAARITARLGSAPTLAADALTDDRGGYALALPAGRYELRAELDGVGAATAQVDLAAGATLRLDLDLRPAGEVIAIAGLGPAEALRQSAEAVNVVDTEAAQRRTADLGEVLARTTGVGIRRAGGLGSAARITLDGLGDDRIRFFLDGVPLALAGYPFGVETVPINLVQRIEVYRGVVPVRFGTDALGGAVNLVAEREPPGAHASISYQTGSFGTHQVTAGASYDGLPGGLTVRGAGFADRAANDYLVDVEVPDAVGRPIPMEVRRFHDGYGGYGANLELALADRAWADAAAVRGFVTHTRKALQHNLLMEVPYGEAETTGTGGGGAVTHRLDLGRGVSSELALGYAATRGAFRDHASCVYDWFGRCVDDRETPGEVGLGVTDARWWDHELYARLGVAWRLAAAHRIRAAIAPTATLRTGDERRALDEPYRAGDDERLASVVAGAEYTYATADDRLEATAFGKAYLRGLRVDYADPIEPTVDQLDVYPGAGIAARYRFAAWGYAKASYEWAARLPTPYEVMGDGALVLANHALRPERSHNVNLGGTAAWMTPIGALDADVNVFLRDARDLIVALGDQRTRQHFNVYAARAFGVEAAAGWTSRCDHLGLTANATWMSFRNASGDGAFGAFDGDRIPSVPYLFANLEARATARAVASPTDEVTVTWTSRYVHDFYRGWESLGDPRYKQSVDAQLVHTIGASYRVAGDPTALGFAIEAHNVTDARAYDYYGLQRPGRAIYVKTTARF